PKRLAALRDSALGHLPLDALAGLADHARWLHPRPGSVLAVAGAPLPEVFVVVDGSVEGRRPGDPGGTVRQRVGPGGVVGLGAAVAGNPAPLSFHTVGTSLLAVPSAAVATAYAGAVTTPVDPTEIEAAFSQTPGLSGLTEEERHELTLRARLASVPPDGPVPLPGPDEAVIVVAGVVVWPDGTELGHGSVILPSPRSQPGDLGIARSWTRLCVVPLVTVLGAPPAPVGGRPRSGVHPPAAYPPLQIPPGPPPDLDDAADRRFERPLWWLVVVLLLLALVLTGTNLRPGPAWAEMPAVQLLLSVP